MKEVRDLVMDDRESLCAPGQFEPLHDPFVPSRWRVRVLSPIVEPPVLAMLDVKAHLRSPGPERSELVRDHDAQRRDGGFEEPRHESPCCLCASSVLD
jgi:hypothetical protein